MSLRLFVCALLLALGSGATSASAEVASVLWIPSGPASVPEDEAVLRSLSEASPVGRIDRCLATYEQLAESRCEGIGVQGCLDRLAREAEADLVLLRRVDGDALDLLAYENARTPARRAKLDRSLLGRSLPLPTCTWLLDGRLSVEAADPWNLGGEPLEAPPLIDLRPIRRYVGRGGLAVLELLREAHPAITDELDVTARPRHVGGVVAVYHDFE